MPGSTSFCLDSLDFSFYRSSLTSACLDSVTPGLFLTMATPNHAADEADMGLTLQQKESALENSLSDEPGDAHTPKYPLTNLDAGLVGWDGQDDPQNPRNFSERKKTSLVLLVSSITVVSPLASSMFAPALGSLAIDFHVTEELLLSFTVSVFVLGYVVRGLLPCRRSK